MNQHCVKVLTLTCLLNLLPISFYSQETTLKPQTNRVDYLIKKQKYWRDCIEEYKLHSKESEQLKKDCIIFYKKCWTNEFLQNNSIHMDGRIHVVLYKKN